MKLNFKKTTTILVGGCLVFACNNSPEKNEINEDALDPNNSLNTNFDGKIFSIPSPIQMSLLLKESKSTFNESLLNSLDNNKKYSTEYQQALNLGIYGTDLGYASINEQNSISLKYLSVVEGLTSKLGLESAFDKTFLTRFEKYHTDQDSVMHIISDAFRKGDNFLKNSKRKATSALILTGGWIESMHFACEMTLKKENKKINERIGEQQQTLNTIVEVLSEYNEKGSNDELIADMKDLQTSFNKVVIDYEFVKPTTNTKSKTTTLNHKMSVKITSDVMKEITEKLQIIRKKITQ